MAHILSPEGPNAQKLKSWKVGSSDCRHMFP